MPPKLWLWHAGSPLALLVEQENGAIATIRLGGDVTQGYAPQHLVPANRWQSTEARAGWALVSCVVVPGFEFSGFELAAPGWAPDRAESILSPLFTLSTGPDAHFMLCATRDR
jgi:predicted cupin superfamily sugar epimerase